MSTVHGTVIWWGAFFCLPPRTRNRSEIPSTAFLATLILPQGLGLTSISLALWLKLQATGCIRHSTPPISLVHKIITSHHRRMIHASIVLQRELYRIELSSIYQIKEQQSDQEQSTLTPPSSASTFHLDSEQTTTCSNPNTRWRTTL